MLQELQQISAPASDSSIKLCYSISCDWKYSPQSVSIFVFFFLFTSSCELGIERHHRCFAGASTPHRFQIRLQLLICDKSWFKPVFENESLSRGSIKNTNHNAFLRSLIMPEDETKCTLHMAHEKPFCGSFSVCSENVVVFIRKENKQATLCEKKTGESEFWYVIARDFAGKNVQHKNYAFARWPCGGQTHEIGDERDREPISKICHLNLCSKM